jgi:putative alpha-1,2-mannosidase
MIGNPALPVLADAYLKGIRNYNVEQAYRYAVLSSEKFSNPDDKDFYWLPFSISNTLEYVYADWCLAQLAKVLGKTEDAEHFLRKSGYYRNIFDSSVNWFLPRLDNGDWENGTIIR